MKNKLKLLKSKFNYILDLRKENFPKIVHAIKSQIKARILGYPNEIMIEPINICNLNCALCSAPQKYITRKRLAMTLENFKIIIDDVKKYAHSIYLSNAGEPMLNKDIFKMIEYASKNNLSTSLSTNATLLHTAAIRHLLYSGLDHLIISLDGATKHSYEKFRVGARFENVIENIKNLCNEKRRLRKAKPYIELQFIVTRYNENEIEDINKLAEKMGVDRLHFKSLYLCSHVYGSDERERLAEEYLPKRKDVKNRYEVSDGITICKWRSATCSYWQNRSVILADGTVVMCCYDINGDFALGNILEEGKSFRDIWNSEKYKNYRNNLMYNKKLPLCKKCDE